LGFRLPGREIDGLDVIFDTSGTSFMGRTVGTNNLYALHAEGHLEDGAFRCPGN
jgi:hypothetical protein